jgi:hypothetical protein
MMLAREPSHIHVELRPGATGVYVCAWIQRPGDRHPPTMLTIEPTRREVIASVLGWAFSVRRSPG